MIKLKNATVVGMDFINMDFDNDRPETKVNALITLENGASITFNPRIIHPYGNAEGIEEVGSLITDIMFDMANDGIGHLTIGEFIMTYFIENLYACGEMILTDKNENVKKGVNRLLSGTVYEYIKKADEELLDRTETAIRIKNGSRYVDVNMIAEEFGIDSLDCDMQTIMIEGDKVRKVNTVDLINEIA